MRRGGKRKGRRRKFHKMVSYVACTVGALAVLVCMASAAPRPPPECHDRACNSPDHPVLKYNGTCFCESHPCHTHTCDPAKGFPILAYEYDPNGKLDCYCRKQCPDNLCAGQRVPPQCSRKEHHCPKPDHPVLAYEKDQCVCKSHPCVVAGRGGCPKADMPWLDYSYDRHGKLDCFCRPDPCKKHVCENPKYPYARWDQEGHCYCSSIPYKSPV